MAFCDDMAGAFERADLVICRAGASALAELAAAGKAAVLVPYPHAADDHQFHNARAFVTAGAARMALDQEWNGERMVREIGAVLGAVGRLEKMEGAARRLSSEGAVEKTADELERAARKEKV
jgi:UDP-N-acetylglucosamine--N-acetylmuramyl-(pentapeptide) pyrophosphoryl-undecaprenol N-acetylglucosamine transferase